MRSFIILFIFCISLNVYGSTSTIEITDNLVLQDPQKARYFPNINTFIVIDHDSLFIKDNLYTPWRQLRNELLRTKNIIDVSFNERFQNFIFHTDDALLIFDREFNFIEGKQKYLHYQRDTSSESTNYFIEIKDKKIFFTSTSILQKRFYSEELHKPLLIIDNLLHTLRYYPYLPVVRIATTYRKTTEETTDLSMNDTFYSGSISASWDLEGKEVVHKRELLGLRKKYHELLSVYHSR